MEVLTGVFVVGIFAVLVSLERERQALYLFHSILPRNCNVIAFSFHCFNTVISYPFDVFGTPVVMGLSSVLSTILPSTSHHFQAGMLYCELSHFSYHF